MTLLHHTAMCHVCGAQVCARNAMGWAANHVKHNPGHEVEVSLGYFITGKKP